MGIRMDPHKLLYLQLILCGDNIELALNDTITMQPPPGQQIDPKQFTTPQTQYIVNQPQQITYMQQPGMPIGTVVVNGYPKTSAQLALILSIVSVFFGGICLAIPSLIIATNALQTASGYPGHPDLSTAKTAKTISWIVIALFSAALMLIILSYPVF